MRDGAWNDRETARIRRIYDRRAAAGHDRRDGRRVAAARQWIAVRAEGETLDVGIGRGAMLPYYPPGLALTGIELSPANLALARRRAAQLGLVVDLRIGDASALPFADDRFDTVVFSFVLCTVPDDRRAVAEAARVLRPGGRLLLAEHVRSVNPMVSLFERVFEPLAVWRMGDHLLREPLVHVLAEGLEVEELERHTLGLEERLAARRPDADALALAG